MPTALVTGSSTRVPDIAIALKSAGFDILAAGPVSAELLPLLGSDATVVLVGEGPEPVGDAGASGEIAALGGSRPPDPLPWPLYAGVEPELSFADWRTEVICLMSEQRS